MSVPELTDEDENPIKRFWDLESLGITKVDEVVKINTEKFMEEKVVFNGERYEVNLPWKNEDRYVDSN